MFRSEDIIVTALVLSIWILISATFWWFCIKTIEGGETRDERLWRLHIKKYIKGDKEKSAWMYRLDLFTALCTNLKEAGRLCKELNK